MSDTRDAALNAIGVLKRREIEARLIAPLIEALARECGREKVLQVVRETVVGMAKDQGRQLVQIMGGNSLQQYAAALPDWTKDDALEIDLLELSDDKLHFNVTRCGYAEMYEALGLRELGLVLSCERDGALMKGFNSDVSLQRSQTILEGAPHCDFRYAHRSGLPSDDKTS
jgi:hypothetical protein